MKENQQKSLKVFLVENELDPNNFYTHLKQVWNLSSTKNHVIIDSPIDADIILFVDVNKERFYQRLRKHPFLIQFPEKSFVYDESDAVIPFLPGIYTSAEKSFINLKRLRNYCYLSRHSYSNNSFIIHRKEKKEFLFSFLGGSTSLLRKRLYNIDFNQPNILVEDTTYYQHWNYAQVSREQMQQRFVDICAKSSFVLCPRGAGCGSIRLFEMMEMGVAPVLIADNYLLPKGPRWEEFVVIVKEKDIRKLPKILKNHASEADKMGDLARKAWKEWFAPDKQFNYIVEACNDIKENRILNEKIYRFSWKFLIVQSFIWSNTRYILRKMILKTVKVLNIKFPYSIGRV
jgi:hypothetical protein